MAEEDMSWGPGSQGAAEGPGVTSVSPQASGPQPGAWAGALSPQCWPCLPLRRRDVSPAGLLSAHPVQCTGPSHPHSSCPGLPPRLLCLPWAEGMWLVFEIK